MLESRFSWGKLQIAGFEKCLSRNEVVRAHVHFADFRCRAAISQKMYEILPKSPIEKSVIYVTFPEK